jgi:hypothetical protein
MVKKGRLITRNSRDDNLYVVVLYHQEDLDWQVLVGWWGKVELQFSINWEHVTQNNPGQVGEDLMNYHASGKS